MKRDLCDHFSTKLKQRVKLVKMTDRSVAGYDTAAEYETESIASNSEDRKRIKQAENRALNQRKCKIFNKSLK